MRSLFEALAWLLAGAVVLLALSRMGHAEKPACSFTPGLYGILSLSLGHYPDDTRLTLANPEVNSEYRRYIWAGFVAGDRFLVEPAYYPCAISSGQLASFQFWVDLTELNVVDAGPWIYVGSTMGRWGYWALQMAFSDTQRHFLPPLELEVIDPNVRGDAFWTASTVAGEFVADWHVIALAGRGDDPCWTDTTGDGVAGVGDYLDFARSFGGTCEER